MSEEMKIMIEKLLETFSEVEVALFLRQSFWKQEEKAWSEKESNKLKNGLEIIQTHIDNLYRR